MVTAVDMTIPRECRPGLRITMQKAIGNQLPAGGWSHNNSRIADDEFRRLRLKGTSREQFSH